MNPDLTRTSSVAPGSASAPPAGRSGRFVTGTLLAGRYRIVSLLGSGGMGEVYKADDIKLDHPVALKFLPETIAMSPGALARFHGEVRIARQVSHQNVCRVYDIADIDGLHFLTMEFIDGEDLASLLRRIGRLPPDKAVQVSRQLCAGLAAAHDAGVLHRDLKPHNVMIDGRGRARITDFGVAALAREVRQDRAVVGTPAYMAPEQVRGDEANVRSDIYSLGLVLYEIFTGKRAIDATTLADAVLHHSSRSAVTTPSDVVRDLDPLVERVIVRCLERDPAARPASAIQVAAALPGGDPLHTALAAGETPSPEMLAAAGSQDTMRPMVALGLAVAIAVVILFVAIAARQFTVLGRVAGDASPEVLQYRAREALAELSYADRGRDDALGFVRDMAYVTYDRTHRPAAGRIERLALSRPASLQFWYRESPAPLAVLLGIDLSGPPVIPPVSLENPPHARRGMRYVRLDMKGRLVEFGAIPLETDDRTAPAAPMDWNVLFKLAGLERQAFQPAPPTWTPRTAFDERAAWTGVYPEQPDLPLRLDAAAYRGRLVELRSSGPWSDESVSRPASGLLETVVFFLLTIIGAGLAWFNVHTGRSDRRGAARLGGLLLVLSLLSWALGAHHVAIQEELRQLRLAISQALFSAVAIYLAYLAVEPHVRRRWPTVLLAWSRVLAGRWRDPLVGRETLIGIAFGAAVSLVEFTASLALSRTMDADSDGINSFVSLGRAAAVLVAGPLASIALGLLFTVLLLVLRIVLRFDLLVFAVVVVGLSAVGSAGGASAFGAVLGGLTGIFATLALTRFGLVALIACLMTSGLFGLLRAALAWGVGTGGFLLAIIIALTAGAAYLAIGSPRLLPRRS